MGTDKDYPGNGHGPGLDRPPSGPGPCSRGTFVRTAVALLATSVLFAFAIWTAVLYRSKLDTLQSRVDQLESQIDVYIQNYIEEHLDTFIQQVSITKYFCLFHLDLKEFKTLAYKNECIFANFTNS